MPTAVLSDLERRITGNLSIPRNADDLAAVLRADPHTPNYVLPFGATAADDADPVPLDAARLTAELQALETAGLVLHLGRHDDPAKLAASLERKTNAVTMHDDKARIYAKRMAIPERAGRMSGDLWMFTDDAFAMLTAPAEGARTMTTREVSALISAEFARTLPPELHAGSIFDLELEPGDGRGGGFLVEETELHNALLYEEWESWARAVSDAHEAVTGERPLWPVAGGAGYGDATELLILAADAGGTAYGETSPTFSALTTVAVTDADTGSTITRATYTGYADKSTALSDYNAPSAGAHTNANPITWAGATGSSSTVIGYARVTTSGGGRLIRYGTTASTVVSASNTPASIAAGLLSDTLD